MCNRLNEVSLVGSVPVGALPMTVCRLWRIHTHIERCAEQSDRLSDRERELDSLSDRQIVCSLIGVWQPLIAALNNWLSLVSNPLRLSSTCTQVRRWSDKCLSPSWSSDSLLPGLIIVRLSNNADLAGPMCPLTCAVRALCELAIYVIAIVISTTANGGSLGSLVDEERS